MSKKTDSEIENEFDILKSIYPERCGSNPWKGAKGALSAYRARRKEGHSYEDIRKGLIRYSVWCSYTGKIGTERVMQAKRFFGPGEEFLNLWSLPFSSRPRDTRDRTLEEDCNDHSWAYSVQDYIDGVSE